MRFGARLAQLLQEAEENQADLAKALGVAFQTVSGWVTGKREPDYDMLFRLAARYNVSIDFLLGRTNIRLPSPPPDKDPIHDIDLWLRGSATSDDIDLVRVFLEARRKKRQEDARGSRR